MWERRATDDAGFAMLFVIGAIALITTVAFGGFVLARQALHESVRNTSEHRAYQAAATGLDQELSWFDPKDLSRYPVSVPLGTQDDYYVATVAQDGVGGYILTCEGRSGDATATCSVRFKYLNLWDMNISGGEGAGVGSGSGLNGTSWIYGSVYVNGDVEWTANGRIYIGPVFLKNGEWKALGNGQVGTPDQYVDAYGPVPTGGNYYTRLRGSAPELDLPKITDKNMADWLLMAKNTAKQPRVGTKHPNGDPVDYTVWTGPSTIGGADFGDIDADPIAYRYDPVKKYGTIYFNQVDINGDGIKDIDPVIYCDDRITIHANVRNYRGRGILVAKSGFTINGSLIPASGLTEKIGPPKDQKTVPVMDAQNCLGMLTQGDVYATSKGDFPTYGLCAAIFANGMFTAPSSSHLDFRGSLICKRIDIKATNVILATQPGLYKSLPKGMPELHGFTARGDWVRH